MGVEINKFWKVITELIITKSKQRQPSVQFVSIYRQKQSNSKVRKMGQASSQENPNEIPSQSRLDVEYHKRRLEIARREGDKAKQALAHKNIGNCYGLFEQYDKAIEHHKLRLQIAKEIGDKAGERHSYGFLGLCYQGLVQYDNALEYHNRSLQISKEIGDKAGEGEAYGYLGKCYKSIGQRDKALEYLERSLHVKKQTRDKAGLGEAYSDLGNCYRSRGQYDKALEYHNLHLGIARGTGDKAGERCACTNIGICYDSLGKYDKALQYNERSLKISKDRGDKDGERTSYGNLGNCYCALGQYDKAMKYHKLHLEIAKQTGDKRGEGRAYGQLGVCYGSMEQYEKALQYIERSLQINKETGDKAGELGSYANLGNCHLSLGQHDKALEYYNLRLGLAQETGDKASEGASYGHLGNYYQSLKQDDKAIKYLNLYLRIVQEISDKAGELLAYGNLGCCYQSLGQYHEALKCQNMSLNIAQRIGDKAGEGRANANLGILHASLGQYEKAKDVLLKCLECKEELFGNTPRMDEHRASIRSLFIKAERLLVEILADEGRAEEALLAAEKGRSRALTELIRDLSGTHRLPGNSVESVDDIREVVSDIDCPVIFFALPNKTSQLLTWVIQPDGGIEFKRATVSVSPVQIEYQDVKCEDRSLPSLHRKGQGKVTKTGNESESATMAPALMKESELGTSQDESLRQRLVDWYQAILQPVRHFVNGNEVVIVPDQQLSLVPFPGLIDDDGHYVVETLRARLVPSLTTAKMIARYPCEHHESGIPVIVGDPAFPASRYEDVQRLPFAKIETEKIGELLGVEPLTGEAATKRAFLQRMRDANLIHIAAHGNAACATILLAADPGITEVDLKPEDYLLTPADLERERLKARLVVLSCCHSGNGHVTGEGVMSIARAFIGAGAHAVLMTVQVISDVATLVFMEKFYARLVGGAKTSEALQSTMKTMMHSADGCSAPEYWAPFSLIGADVTPFPAAGSGTWIIFSFTYSILP